MKDFSRRQFLSGGVGGIAVLVTARGRDLVVDNQGLVRAANSGSQEGPGEFSVGNELISRQFAVKENQAQTVGIKARTEISVISDEFEIICRTGERTLVLNSHNSTPQGQTVSLAGEHAILVWSSEEPALEIRVNYQADRGSPYIFKWLEITHHGSRPVTLQRVTVDAWEVQDVKSSGFSGRATWKFGAVDFLFLCYISERI